MRKIIFIGVAILALLIELTPIPLSIVISSVLLSPTLIIFREYWFLEKIMSLLIVVLFMIPFYSIYVGIRTESAEIFRRKMDIFLFVLNSLIIIGLSLFFVVLALTAY